MKKDQKKWDEKYRSRAYTHGNDPNPFLKKHIGLLHRGKALDIAAGEGQNAVFLAQQGFRVEAVDISPIGLAKARKLASAWGVKIKTVQADLDDYEIETGRYDLITNFYFLDRRLFPKIRKGLNQERIKKGGEGRIRDLYDRSSLGKRQGSDESQISPQAK